MITVIGLHDPAFVPEPLRQQILAADLVVGGARHLAAFPEARGERLVIDAQIESMLQQVRAAYDSGKTVVVLGSGDPLWYGVGATLRRAFAADELHVIPAPTAAQMAFAALGEPWTDALLLSAHGRPLAPVIARLVAEFPRPAAILTDDKNTPAKIAISLLQVAFSSCRAAVCERLATPEQRIVWGTLYELSQQQFDSLNVFVVLPEKRDYTPASVFDRPFGLEDDELEHDGLITHLEVRAVALAMMRLRLDSILWDIGAGSGSVSIEAERLMPFGWVYAVERDSDRFKAMERNIEILGAPRITEVQGEAPEVCTDWPDPDAIFIGGSGGKLPELVALAAQRLRPQGRLVINLVTLELLTETLQLLAANGFVATVRQVAVSRSRPLRGQTYLAALNPVYIVSAEREA